MLARVQPTRLSPPMEPAKERVRVLHVVENLDSQAVESWLLRVLKGSCENYPGVHWSFFCVLGREGRFDDLARRMGATVIHSQKEVGDKLRFLYGLREEMKLGRYDVLHCHHDVMSAAYLLAARGLPFKKRIVHAHNTSLSLPTPNRFKVTVAREPMRRMCLKMADQIIGSSTEALGSMLGNVATNPNRHRVIHYAVDIGKFSNARSDRERFRKELNCGPAVRILLFVGRMITYKNPSFVIEILDHVRKVRPDVVAVFAGVGNQEKDVLALAQERGLAGLVRVLGFRDDVPELMANSDVLIWPSLEDPKEGLGLGIVEAQAACLPVLMSQSVPAEAMVLPELVDVLPLAAGPEAWSRRVLEIMDRTRPSREGLTARIESSSFSMSEGVRNIMSLYDNLDTTPPVAANTGPR